MTLAAFLFLSTPSARRATYDVRDPLKLRQISIHALREEGDEKHTTGDKARTISIHALREEGDAFRGAFSCVEP